MRAVKIIDWEGNDLSDLETLLKELINQGYEVAGYTVRKGMYNPAHSVIMVQKYEPGMTMNGTNVRALFPPLHPSGDVTD